MTDRIDHLTIVLDGDYRTDDVQSIIDAIKMIRGVASVEPGKPVSLEAHAARFQARQELSKKLWEVLK